MPSPSPLDVRSLQAIAARHGHQLQHEALRISAQLEFAEGLQARHPARAASWRRLITNAAAQAQAILEADPDPATVRRRLAGVEDTLAPIARVAKTYTIWCAGHAHIDMNWMWSWPETVAVVNDTFQTVLRLMEDFPEFHFTQSQASCYRMIEEHHPALLATIRARVREGRWEAAASHWVENDKNLSGSESLCRHLLTTRRYLKDLLGLDPQDAAIDWSPDAFGHAATLPVYLSRGGVRYYYGHRFGNVVARRPPVFRWRGPDGSSVLVINDSICGYNRTLDARLGPEMLEYTAATGLKDMLLVYGVGDHGGGPTRRDLLYARELAAWPVFPRLRMSRAQEAFRAIESAGVDIPEITGELNFECTGCYTSQSTIKKANRLAENQLVAAETAAAFAWAVRGRDYPAARLEAAWRDTLLLQFHDILPGSGVHDTRTHALGLFQQTAATTGIIETESLRHLAAGVDTAGGAAGAKAETVPVSAMRSGMGAGVGHAAGGGLPSQADRSAGEGPRPYLLFNPAARTREGVATVTLWDNAPSAMSGGPNAAEAHLRTRAYAVRTPAGDCVAAQLLEVGSYWGHAFAKLAFPIEPLPGLGYGVYTVTEARAPHTAPGVRLAGLQGICAYFPPEQDRVGMENAYVRVILDGRTGGLRSWVDKRSGLEMLDPARPAAVLEYAIERPHPMSAWSLADTGPVCGFRVAGLERRKSGPHVVEWAVRLEKDDNVFTVAYRLNAGDPALHIEVSGTWVERGSAARGVPVLRMAFPLALRQVRARYEIPFGALARDEHAGEEVPALRWAQVSGRTARGRSAGCVVANDCKYGHALDGDTLRVTLLRSSYEPDPLPEVNQHAMAFTLTPFAGTLAVAEAVRLGEALAQPLRVIATDTHAGSLPTQAGLLTVEPAAVVLCAVKRAEDGTALIARVYETTGQRTTARLTLHPALGKPGKAVETDLMENPLAASSAATRGRTVTVPVPPFGIATVSIPLTPPPSTQPG